MVSDTVNPLRNGRIKINVLGVTKSPPAKLYKIYFNQGGAGKMKSILNTCPFVICVTIFDLTISYFETDIYLWEGHFFLSVLFRTSMCINIEFTRVMNYKLCLEQFKK